MATFGELYEQASKDDCGLPSPELKELLRRFYETVSTDPVDESALKGSLKELLRYLTTSNGRTDANCWSVDLFAMGVLDHYDLPDNDLYDVIRYMGEALHDTVAYPQMAHDYGCTPEQLLDRLNNLPPV